MVILLQKKVLKGKIFMKILTVSAALALSFIILSGCSDNNEKKIKQNSNSSMSEKSQQPVQAAMPQTAANPHANLNIPETFQTATANVKPALNEAVAANVIHSAGYTYVEVVDNGKNIWLAGTKTPVKPGQRVYWGQSSVMKNFTSKSLNRTFDEILFVAKFVTQKPATQKMAANNASTGKILSAQNAGGYSYLEVKTGKNVIWIAAPEATVKVNDNISWSGSNKMSNFTSKSLGKTFEEIFFVGAVALTN
jgi:hypothetical protein